MHDDEMHDIDKIEKWHTQWIIVGKYVGQRGVRSGNEDMADK